MEETATYYEGIELDRTNALGSLDDAPITITIEAVSFKLLELSPSVDLVSRVSPYTDIVYLPSGVSGPLELYKYFLIRLDRYYPSPASIPGSY